MKVLKQLAKGIIPIMLVSFLVPFVGPGNINADIAYILMDNPVEIYFDNYLLEKSEAFKYSGSSNKFTMQPLAPSSDGITGEDHYAGTGTFTEFGTYQVSSGPYSTPQENAQSKTGSDIVNIPSGWVYYKNTYNFEIPAASFPKPGVYHYFLSESKIGSNSAFAIDTSNTRKVDIYIGEDSTGQLYLSNYIIWNPGRSQKLTGFTDTWLTTNIRIKKEVTGNQGSKDQYFPFIVRLSSSSSMDSYYVVQSDLSGCDYETGHTGFNHDEDSGGGVTQPQDAHLQENGDNTETLKIWLKHDQYYDLLGVPLGTDLEVSEYGWPEDTNKQGYRVTTFIQEDSDSIIEVDDLSGATPHGSPVNINYGATANYIEFTPSATDVQRTLFLFRNTKNGVVPTGVLLMIIPAVIVFVAGLAGFTVIAVKKARSKKRDRDDDQL